jgi:uncharacterized membrane protein
MRGSLRYSRDDSEFDRAIGFMDATFALALTLLVTTLDVDPIRSNWDSFGTLNDAVGSQVVAFAIAFAVIANFWVVNHRMVASFAAIDYPVIVALLGLIATIVVLPFSTEAVGNPELDDLALPTVVLAINVAAAATLSSFVYWLARKRGLLDPPPDRQDALRNIVGGLIPAGVFLGSIPIAYLASPVAAKVSWLSLIVFNQVFERLVPAKRESK